MRRSRRLDSSRRSGSRSRTPESSPRVTGCAAPRPTREACWERRPGCRHWCPCRACPGPRPTNSTNEPGPKRAGSLDPNGHRLAGFEQGQLRHRHPAQVDPGRQQCFVGHSVDAVLTHPQMHRLAHDSAPSLDPGSRPPRETASVAVVAPQPCGVLAANPDPVGPLDVPDLATVGPAELERPVIARLTVEIDILEHESVAFDVPRLELVALRRQGIADAARGSASR